MPTGYTEYLGREESWIGVYSSNVDAIAFDPTTPTGGVLGVRFLDKKTGGPGAVYYYLHCPASVWEEFLAAESKGKFFHANVKFKYATVGPL